MKKILFLFALITAFACHAQEFKVGDAKYKVIGTNNVSLVDYKKAIGKIELPETVTNPKTNQSYTLTTIGRGAFQGSKLESVVMPASISVIEDNAFKKCKNLKSVTLSPNIKELPECCFEECVSLYNINLSDSHLETIGNRAFKKSGLKKISIPATVNDIKIAAFFGCTNLAYVKFEESSDPDFKPAVLNIWPGAFYDARIVRLGIGERGYSLPWPKAPVGYAFDEQKVIEVSKREQHPQPFSRPSISFLEFNVFGEPWQSFGDNPNPPFLNLVSLRGANIVADSINNKAGLVKLKNIINEYNIRNVSIGGKRMKADEYVKYLGNLQKLKKWEDNLAEFSEELLTDGNPQNAQFELWKLINYGQQAWAEGVDSVWQVYHRFIADSLLKLPTLSDRQLPFADGVAGDIIYGITLEYIPSASSYFTYFSNDLLRKELENGNPHEYDYYLTLAVAEKVLKQSKEPKITSMIFQLVGLCGTDRFKEAADYWPKVKRAIDSIEFEGKGYCLHAMTYMKDFLTEQGYTVKEPVYSKSKKKSNTGEGIAALIEIFVNNAVNDRVNKVGTIKDSPNYKYDDSKYLKDVKIKKK